LRITFEGREWEFQTEAVTVKQAVAMHLAYGFTLDGWFTALAETDPRALQCLWWLMLQQDGQVVPIKDADCSLVQLAAAFADAQETEDQAGPEPDPTSRPSPKEGPPSPEPATPADTTRTHRARPEGGRRTVSTPAI
jgi:hypothetical protein